MAQRKRLSHRRAARPRPHAHRPRGRRRAHAARGGSRWNRVRIDVDLVHEAFQGRGPLFLRRLESVFREQEVVEVEGLLRPAAHALRALAQRGFLRVDHWEVSPGGWLPLPEPAHERLDEPVGHLLHALKSEAWEGVGRARAFAARLSGPEAVRAEVIVRRVHRERGHSLTVELVGSVSERDVHGIEKALRDELTVAHLAWAPLSSKAR